MSSQILRPTTVKNEKGPWLIQGAWGRRTLDPMSRMDLYQQLHRELIDNGVLERDSRPPSNKYHEHVTMTVMRCSWIGGRWVPDEQFALRLKRLRQQSNLTQEQLAEQSGLDVGTVRQLEQGTRTHPQWQTVCALAHGLNMDVVVFVGTDFSAAGVPVGTKESRFR
jgi:DNA-binding XRE family transcriptional regulator